MGRMENPTQWKRYQYRKLVLQRDHHGKNVTPIIPPLETLEKIETLDSKVTSGLDARLNEAYLFHGTATKAAEKIQASGFDLSLAGSHGRMFGRGVYFAEESSKADEYALPDEESSGLCCMLFCRVLCGEMYRATDFTPDLERKLDRRKFDSILGDRKAVVDTYREIIVYDGAQAYAEYVILYQRVYPAQSDGTQSADAEHTALPSTLPEGRDAAKEEITPPNADSMQPISCNLEEYMKQVSKAYVART